jgi:hypothetical protein
MSSFLACALLQPLVFGEPTAPPIVLELHDLRGLPALEYDDGPDFRLLPMLGLYEGSDAPSGDDDATLYMEIFQSIARDELESEGRDVSLDDGVLRLRAPATVQDLAAGTFEFLGGAFGAEIELQIDSFVLPKGRNLPSSLITNEEADQLIASAETKLGSWRTRVSSTHTSVISNTRTVPLVADYDVEIAQSSIAYDPIVLPLQLGTRIQAAAAPAPQGTWLALVVSSSEPLGDVRDYDVTLAGLVGTSVEEKPSSGTARFLGSTTPRTVPGPRKLQTLAVQDRSFVLNTFLPEGRAIVSTTTLNARTARGTRVLVVRRGATALPIHAGYRPGDRGQNQFDSAEPSGNRPEILAIDLSSTRPPVAFAEASDGRSNLGSFPLNAGDGTWASIAHAGCEESQAELEESLSPILDQAEGVGLTLAGPWAVLTGAHGLDAFGIGKRTPVDPLAAMERLRPTPRVFQVTLTLARKGEPSARCTLPVRTDVRSSVVLAAEELTLGDINVEVAQSATVADPVTFVEVDGLVVHVEPRVSRSGAVTLDIAASGCLARGATREFVSGSEVLPNLQLTATDRLRVRERLRLDGSTAGRAIRLGDRSEPAEGLTLDVEMVEVR